MAILTITRHGNMFGYNLTFNDFPKEDNLDVVENITRQADIVHQANVEMIMERLRQMKAKGFAIAKKNKQKAEVLSNA